MSSTKTASCYFWFGARCPGSGQGIPIALWRWEAAKGVTETELSNPRTVPALVDRLEPDPSPLIRKEVASRMLTLLAREPLVRSALQASAAEDEDPYGPWGLVLRFYG
jgi:hypothetical protein